MATNQVSSPADLWALTHEQRQKVGDMLATLSDAEWEAPSLCAGWSVRDVVAHMVETHLMTPPAFMGRFIGSGFNFHRFSTRGIARHAGQSTAELLQQFRDSAPRSTAPPGPRETWLAEALIHGEDVARAVGRTVASSPAALVTVGDYARRTSPLLHGRQRSEGLRLRATDVDWTAGDGPEVSGPAASLIMAITGRTQALADLGGEGLATLTARV